jgi:hypothetical protein
LVNCGWFNELSGANLVLRIVAGKRDDLEAVSKLQTALNGRMGCAREPLCPSPVDLEVFEALRANRQTGSTG